MNAMRAFDAAQSAWDNMLPPEDGPTECLDCNASGYTPDGDTCTSCEGHRWIDADGEPFNVRAVEREGSEA